MRGNIFDIFYQLSMLSIVIPKERVLKKVGLRYNYSIGLGVCRMNKKIIDKYTKEYGVRFSRRQKRKASLALFEDMKDAGYEGTMISGRKVFSKAENYLFGNIKTMKTVIVIPFDTPQHCFWRRVSYYPLNGNKSANKSVLPMFAPVILLYLMVFVMLWIADHFVTSPQLAFGISLFIYFLIFFLLYLMTIGIANRNNYNRYSLSVATAIELAQKLGKDEKRKVGFLFTDKNKTRYYGAQLAVDKFIQENKNPDFICIDCIGEGSVIQIGYNPNMRKMAVKLKQKENIDLVKLSESMRMQNAMGVFSHAVVIARGDLDKDNELCLTTTCTSKDKHIEESMADDVVEMLYNYLCKLS